MVRNDKHKEYQKIEKKIIKCIDCDCDVEVDARNMTKTRCDDCQLIREKNLKSQRNKRYYQKNK